MTTIFSKIIAKEIPAILVYEDEICIVIMDKSPSVLGQTVVIPKEPNAYIFDLPDDIYMHLCKITKLIAKASDSAFDTVRTCEVIEGFEVPHTHIKLYPITNSEHTLEKIMPYTNEVEFGELQKNADRIKKFL